MGRLSSGRGHGQRILRETDLIEARRPAGMRSLFVGFETLTASNLPPPHKPQNLARDYDEVIRGCTTWHYGEREFRVRAR